MNFDNIMVTFLLEAPRPQDALAWTGLPIRRDEKGGADRGPPAVSGWHARTSCMSDSIREVTRGSARESGIVQAGVDGGLGAFQVQAAAGCCAPAMAQCENPRV
jgi:hypothetical protein